MRISDTDNAVMALVQGDPVLMREMYSELLPNIAKYIVKNNGTKMDAHEVFQEALCQILERAKTKGIILKTELKSYIFSTCRNLWRQEINRRSKEWKNDGVLELANGPNTKAELLAKERKWMLFEEKLEQLAPSSRNLLTDYFQGLSYSEIVEKYNYSSTNTAFQRIFKCKKRITALVQSDRRFESK